MIDRMKMKWEKRGKKQKMLRSNFKPYNKSINLLYTYFFVTFGGSCCLSSHLCCTSSEMWVVLLIASIDAFQNWVGMRSYWFRLFCISKRSSRARFKLRCTVFFVSLESDLERLFGRKLHGAADLFISFSIIDHDLRWSGIDEATFELIFIRVILVSFLLPFHDFIDLDVDLSHSTLFGDIDFGEILRLSKDLSEETDAFIWGKVGWLLNIEVLKMIDHFCLSDLP